MIRFENVTKKYKNSKKTALKDINLDFNNRGLVFVVGESGSGKTTLLNLLGLLDDSTSGNIFFDEIEVNQLNNNQKDAFRNQHIGIIFQNINLIEELTIKENILLPLQLQQRDKTDEEVLEQLKTLNIEEDINDYPRYLSGGERQRIAISRALTKDARVVIADEPTGSLDDKNAINIMEMLKDISNDRLVIVVTHQVHLAEKFGDRIIHLKRGQVIEDKTIDDKIENRFTTTWSDQKRYKLPLKVSLKFAYKWFTYKFGRMFFALITFFLTLMSFIVAATIYQFEDYQAMRNGLENEGIKYVKIHKQPYPGQSGSDVMFTYAEADILNDLFDESEYIGTHSGHGIARTISNNGGNGTVENYATITEEKIELFGFSLVGNLPDNNSLAAEVVITNMIAFEIGWLTQDNFYNHAAFQSIIDNHTLIVNLIHGNDVYLYEFSITGIIDTRYEFPDPSIDNSTYQRMYTDELNYGLHSTLFFGNQVQDFILNVYKNVGEAYSDRVARRYYVALQHNGYHRAMAFQASFEAGSMRIDSRLDYSLHMINEMKNMIVQVALVLGGLFLITSLITFIGYIHNMVLNKENSIRIMRSLGMRFSDMNIIFILQDLFISVISVLAATVGALILGYYINESIKDNIYVLIPLVNPTIWIPMLTFLVTFVFAFMITYIQLKKSYRKTKVIE